MEDVAKKRLIIAGISAIISAYEREKENMKWL